MAGQPSHRVHHPNANSWQFCSQSTLTFSKIVFQVYIITIEPCFKCDLAMSSGEGFPKLRFSIPNLLHGC